MNTDILVGISIYTSPLFLVFSYCELFKPLHVYYPLWRKTRHMMIRWNQLIVYFYTEMRHGIFLTSSQIVCDQNHQCPSSANETGLSFILHALLLQNWNESAAHCLLNWEAHTWSRWSPRPSWFPAQRIAAPGAWRWPRCGASESSPWACSSHPWPGVEGRNPQPAVGLWEATGYIVNANALLADFCKY